MWRADDTRVLRGKQAASCRSAAFAWLSATALLVVATTAQAGSPEAARAAKEADRLLATGKVQEACGLFKEASRLDPTPQAMLSLGRCEQRAGWLARALATFRAVASGPRGSAQLAATAAVRALQPKVPTVVVVVDRPLPDQRVEIDGKPLASVDWNRPVAVDPGPLTVLATAPGKKPWQTTVTAAAGPVKPSVVTVRVPPLEDDVTSFAAGETRLVPLDRLSGATWSDGIGFVVVADAPQAEEPDSTPSLPTAKDEELSRTTWETPVSIGAILFQARGHSDWGLRTGLLVRSQMRQRTSHVAPWFDVGVAGGYLPGQKLGFFGGGAHVGVDVHPARLTWIGVGPFFGYQLLGIMGVTDGKAFAHGPDFGLLNVHFRTMEQEGETPTFDANVYVLERISIGSMAAATYVGLRVGVGTTTRLQLFLEGRPAPLDSRAGGLIAPLFFAGIGLGHEK